MAGWEGLGLERGTVEVVSYDPRWVTLFRQAEVELRQSLGGAISDVHHAGSTSVPGLCAKPILDILVSISDFQRGAALVPTLERLGYEYRPDNEILDRHFFRRRRGTARTHHLSLAEPGSNHHRVTLAFRDALRQDPGLAAEYGELKLRLAERFRRDREAYINGKTSFVVGVLAR